MGMKCVDRMQRAVSAALLAAVMVAQFGPALAETPTEIEPTPETLPALPPDAIPVTDAGAIKAALDDLTIYGRYYDGEDWIEYHRPDGVSAYNEKGCTYPGRWWIEEGNICYAYPNYRDNAANCFLMFVRPNGGIYFVAFDSGGSGYLASNSIKTAPGNDAHLPLGGMSPCVGV